MLWLFYNGGCNIDSTNYEVNFAVNTLYISEYNTKILECPFIPSRLCKLALIVFLFPW